MTLITVSNLNKKPLKDVNFVLKDHTTSILLGPNNSGKTTLIKLLSGIIKSENSIRINRTYIEKMNAFDLSNKIQVLLDSSFSFFYSTVEEELSSSLKILDIENDEKRKIVKDMALKLDLSKLLKSDPSVLSFFEQQKLRIGKCLITNPDVFFLDDIFKYLKIEEQKFLAQFLTSYVENGLTLSLACKDPIVPLLFKDAKVYLLNKGEIVKSGSYDQIFEDDGFISKIGLKLPFMVDLSIKLKYYNLIDEIIIDKERLVDILWK